jgi:hypothetical protein
MQRLWTLLLSGLLWASLVATAQSQEGSSLYDPFVEPSSVARAERFVDDLRVPGHRRGTLDISRRQLEEGVIVSSRTGELVSAPVPAGGPSERASGGKGLEPSFGWLPGLAVTVLVAAGVARVMRTDALSRAA